MLEVKCHSKECELPHSKRSKRKERKKERERKERKKERERKKRSVLILLTFLDCHATYDSNLEERRKLNIMLSKTELIFLSRKEKRANTKVFKVVCCILSKQKTYFLLFLFNLHLLAIHKREWSSSKWRNNKFIKENEGKWCNNFYVFCVSI